MEDAVLLEVVRGCVAVAAAIKGCAQGWGERVGAKGGLVESKKVKGEWRWHWMAGLTVGSGGRQSHWVGMQGLDESGAGLREKGIMGK